MTRLPAWKDSALFTPGPLTTSGTVKQAMLIDLGSRDDRFIRMVREVRSELVRLGQAEEPEYTAVLMQGSGTFGIESLLGSAVPADGRLLVAANGAYGKRMIQMAQVLGLPLVTLEKPENEPITAADCLAALDQHSGITHLAIVHCETTSGILNPIEDVGKALTGRGVRYLVDAMSSFGALPVSLPQVGIDFLVSSSNKCIEGVPGFSFVLAHQGALAECEGRARSLSLDLFAQWQGLENNGQFRFTPPTHAILAFHRALAELRDEGGPMARQTRYQANRAVLLAGLRKLGLKTYLPMDLQSPIITSIHFPEHPQFHFETFYRKLSERGQVIYPGKVSQTDCFRIGTIGRLQPSDFQTLLAHMREVLIEMGIPLPSTGPSTP